MAVLNVSKGTTERVYYKTDQTLPGDIRFDFWKANSQVLVNNVSGTRIPNKGVYYYDLAVPNEDIYLIGRGYAIPLEDITPIVFKAGNASPQTLFFYSPEAFQTPPPYRIYDINGLALQSGNLNEIIGGFWSTPITANLSPSPFAAAASEDTFFFEVAEVFLASTFALDISETGIINFNGTATLDAKGTLVPSGAEIKLAKATLFGDARIEASAVLVPKNTFEKEIIISDNDPILDAFDEVLKKIQERLKIIRRVQPVPAIKGGFSEVVNIIQRPGPLPLIDVTVIRQRISRFGQIVPIVPVGGTFSKSMPINAITNVEDNSAFIQSRILNYAGLDSATITSGSHEKSVGVSGASFIGSLSIDVNKFNNLTPRLVTNAVSEKDVVVQLGNFSLLIPDSQAAKYAALSPRPVTGSTHDKDIVIS